MPGLLSVAGDALAAQIGEMRAERRAARGVADDAGLDDGARERPVSRRLAWTLARWPRPKRERLPGADPPGARDATAGLLGGGERLGDEGPGALRRLERMRPGRMRKSSSLLMA